MKKTDSKISLSALLLAATLAAGPTALAQHTTEQFIPIGLSPGISNVTSYIGPVTEVDGPAQTFSLEVDGETRLLRVSADTRIWLDRSKVRKTNIDGDFGDIRPGLVIEVRYDDKDPGAAVWVKIQAA